jgi:hypothetical protein
MKSLKNIFSQKWLDYRCYLSGNKVRVFSHRREKQSCEYWQSLPIFANAPEAVQRRRCPKRGEEMFHAKREVCFSQKERQQVATAILEDDRSRAKTGARQAKPAGVGRDDE